MDYPTLEKYLFLYRDVREYDVLVFQFAFVLSATMEKIEDGQVGVGVGGRGKNICNQTFATALRTKPDVPQTQSMLGLVDAEETTL